MCATALAAFLLGFAGFAAATSVPMPAHQSFVVRSAVLHEIRHINVYVPPDYDTATTTRYQVLYMPDGGMQEDFPHVATDMDAAIRAGAVQPMIVVGIENTERRRDMTGPTDVAADRAIAPRVGGSAAFRAFIANELMPQVRQRYRTNGKTAVVGESLAGLFVLETFFLQPKLFDTYIAISPSLWWNNQALLKAATGRLRSWPMSMKRTLYFSTSGDDDIDHAGETLEAILRTHARPKVRWLYVPRRDLQHSNIYVRSSPDIFRQLFPRSLTR